jgi:hypothetical protein
MTATWRSCSWWRQRPQQNLVVVNPRIRDVVVIGSRDNDDYPKIVFAVMTSRMTMMTMSWLGSWWGPDDGNNVAAPVVNGNGIWFGLSLL